MTSLSAINHSIQSHRNRISSANAEIASLEAKIARLEDLLTNVANVKSALASDLQANEARLKSLSAESKNPKNVDDYTNYFVGILRGNKYTEAEEGLQLADKKINEEIESCKERINSLNSQIDYSYGQISILNRQQEDWIE